MVQTTKVKKIEKIHFQFSLTQIISGLIFIISTVFSVSTVYNSYQKTVSKVDEQLKVNEEISKNLKEVAELSMNQGRIMEDIAHQIEIIKLESKLLGK
jgi:cell division protein FtsL